MPAEGGEHEPMPVDPAAAALVPEACARTQVELDARNAEFWNTLCGTHLARQLGISDSSPESLRKFDDWYFAFYPYLAKYIPFTELRGQRVLEVGLGYGTVAQRIAENGGDYTGLDIASGAVEMVHHRLRLCGLRGRAQQGNILRAPFDDCSFDFVVAIGCFHHTGDMQRALDESHRILRRSGVLVGMVYNAYSYRRWFNAARQTARYLMWDAVGGGRPPRAVAAERAAYDTDADGAAAPFTDFVSRRRLRYMCQRYASFAAELANIDQERPFRHRSREALLRTRWPSLCGLDIYFRARK
jgi:SAM-dependent methyltransferase